MNRKIATSSTDKSSRSSSQRLNLQGITNTKNKNLKEVAFNFIKTQNHPCLSAQSVVKNETLEIGNYKSFGSLESAKALGKDLLNFIKKRKGINTSLASFMAVFNTPKDLSELAFETLLWRQLQLLHDLDGNEWDSEVSNNPEDSKFSFSFGGKAFYIIGMHPNSSRMARQFPYPALVFNLHEQFETLREEGHYYKMRDIIRERDRKLQGYVNAMVADHGTSSEAKQYSGRVVDESWKCPFHNKK